jgi:predicted DNA-binding protein (UPF0251 family)
MARPQNDRIVHGPPLFTEFKPIGVSSKNLDMIQITLDEFEALRLADYLGLDHSEAADEMEISRSVFTRLIEKARGNIARLIVEGKMLTIEGGNVHFKNNILKCNQCGHMFKIPFSQKVSECPSCNSESLHNLAGGFGHGRCCEFRSINKRR